MSRRIALWVRAEAPARVEEAMRAALGLTLRGATVTVAVAPARLATALAVRVARTLTSFGHVVLSGETPEVWRVLAKGAEIFEIWTDLPQTQAGSTDGSSQDAPEGSSKDAQKSSPKGLLKDSSKNLSNDSPEHSSNDISKSLRKRFIDSSEKNQSAPRPVEASEPSPGVSAPLEDRAVPAAATRSLSAPRPVLHLVRPGAVAPAPATPGHPTWRVDLSELDASPRPGRIVGMLTVGDGAPIPPGPVDAIALVALMRGADRVVTW